ncbi:MAG: hypothetical protein KF802_00910 [Bdellovibrionaceae bacterium]|nr:hypothetical protein [Pseudobdellovibrionaceae bacterium]MBX3034278.1 hypothetical protein [Pseudobdellovibrionaceae bacterium]
MTKFLFGALLTLILSFVTALYFLSRWNHRPEGPQEMTSSFTSYVTGSRGVQRVQLFEADSVEVIERTSQYSLFWNTFKLPDMVVLARVPVRYVYYVDLQEPFEVSEADGRLRVQAPALKAALPAPDVSGLSFEVKSGGLFRDARAAFEDLRKTITPLLKENAERQIPLVREQAREQMKALILAWCRDSSACAHRAEQLDVRFQNEDAGAPAAIRK